MCTFQNQGTHGTEVEHYLHNYSQRRFLLQAMPWHSSYNPTTVLGCKKSNLFLHGPYMK